MRLTVIDADDVLLGESVCEVVMLSDVEGDLVALDVRVFDWVLEALVVSLCVSVDVAPIVCESIESDDVAEAVHNWEGDTESDFRVPVLLLVEPALIVRLRDSDRRDLDGPDVLIDPLTLRSTVVVAVRDAETDDDLVNVFDHDRLLLAEGGDSVHVKVGSRELVFVRVR